MITKDKKEFYNYVNVINNLIDQNKKKDILVIGAGGFTVGFNDKVNNYIFVDVDDKLIEIAEGKFLKEKLGLNKKFQPDEIRKYLKDTDEKYDIIVVDAYTNRGSVPTSLLTMEFYNQLKNKLNKDGIVILNMVSDIFLRDTYSRNIDTTLRAVFDTVTYIPLIDIKKNKYDTSNKKNHKVNIIYVVRDKKYKKEVYVDDKNNSSFDRKNY